MKVPGICGLVLAILLPPAPGVAQTIRGRIIADLDERAIHQAQISVLATDPDAVLASSVSVDGNFLFDLREAGTYRLRAEALGYQTLTTAPVTVPANTVISVELRLSTSAIALDPLRIVAERREPPFMQDIRRRQRIGFGRFIMREQLDQRQGSRLQDVLRDTGLWIQEFSMTGIDGGSVPGHGPPVPLVTARLRGTLSRDCHADLYLNGVRQYGAEQDPRDSWPRVQDLFLFRPDEIEAIEIYRGAAEVPAEYSGSTAACGVVAFWLRSGYEPRGEAELKAPLPPPRVRAGVRSMMMRIDGPHAPDPASVIEVAFALAGTPRLTFSLHARYGRHVLAPQTVSRLTRPAPDANDDADARPMSLLAGGIEPVLTLFQVGPMRPVIAVRGQFVHRRFSTSSGTQDGGNRVHSSHGWAGGVSAGMEFDLSRSFVAEIMYGREWSSLGAFPQLETYWRRTASRWNAAVLRTGLAVRL